MLLNDNFESIDAAALQALIDNGVPESTTLEFKRETYGNADADKKELLKDVSAFANTLGGDLLLGIEDEKGVAKAITPLAIEDLDKEIQRLTSILQTTLEPALIGLRMQRIRVAGGEVIHIRVPRSFTPPHRIIFRGSNRFFGRNSAGAHELSMPDLRRLFGQERDMYEQARAFVGERLLRIQAGDTPVPVIQTGSGFLFHLLPVMDVARERRIEIKDLKAAEPHLRPMGARGWGARVTLEGLNVYRVAPDHLGYTQVFRNGCIEAYWADAIRGHDGRRVVPSVAGPKEILQSLKQYARALSELGAAAPVQLQLQYFGAEGTELGVDPMLVIDPPTPPLGNAIILPPATLYSVDDEDELMATFREQMDFLWNAFGYEKCFYFDANDTWNPHS